MDAAQAKRNRLPFKPPRRQSEGTNGSTTNKTTSKTTSRKPSSTTTASASKSTSKTKTTTSKSSSSKAKSTASKTPASNSRKRKAQSITISSDSEDSNASNPGNDSDNEDNHSTRSASPFTEPDYILAEIVTTNNKSRNIESDEPGIPPKLLTTILHHHFQNKKTKITKDANEVVAKYMDIFVREALARAAFERADAANKDGSGRYAEDGFLEVEDLEKLAPQMLLDF
ncbi:uncharacterized protein BHQ10_003820 [Talaromyces amestolkiae]|uniref:CENP-S associating centromere protein X domain-containing protein n=1 Tax=Talaromyces amestolkiae TaxID=1196081 RepID=A0A364KW80_TALAM|nr:uncharacterized protein BHQ10_003820 [Talaromyces amestolkiae]RAO67808.1 hypothetical protein BHQ10_003820 [Talaromyces amestolkiae]